MISFVFAKCPKVKDFERFRRKSNFSRFSCKARFTAYSDLLFARVILLFQVVDLYWGVDPEEWDNPDLQRLRMKLLEECLKTSAGPCFVVSSACFPDTVDNWIFIVPFYPKTTVFLYFIAIAG